MTKFVVVRYSGYGGKAIPMIEFPDFPAASTYCSENNWEFKDENNFVWNLDIKEIFKP